MSDNHYDTLESIFSVPDDLDASQKEDLITSTLTRVRATVNIINAAAQGQLDVSLADFSSYLWGLEGQLEQLEKLIKFEVNEDKS